MEPPPLRLPKEPGLPVRGEPQDELPPDVRPGGGMNIPGINILGTFMLVLLTSFWACE